MMEMPIHPKLREDDYTGLTHFIVPDFAMIA